VIEKALTYSENLMLFLPKNTSITDLTNRLSMQKGFKKKNLNIEIQMLFMGNQCKAMLVLTGKLASEEDQYDKPIVKSSIEIKKSQKRKSVVKEDVSDPMQKLPEKRRDVKAQSKQQQQKQTSFYSWMGAFDN
jgi:hypothetical protein